MKKFLIVTICAIVLLAAPLRSLAIEVERTPITQSEVVSFENAGSSITENVDLVMAGNDPALIIIGVVILVAIAAWSFNQGMSGI